MQKLSLTCSPNHPPPLTPQSGLCECGCGQPAPIAAKTDSRLGWTKGKPKRFIHGHRARLQEEAADSLYEVSETGCWIWIGRISPYGYGTFGDRLAHRVIWVRSGRDLRDDEQLDHLCHDRATCSGGRSCPHRRCVNPEHLQIATGAVNSQRGAKGKLVAAEVLAIRASVETPTVLASRYGVSPSTISNVRARRVWRNV